MKAVSFFLPCSLLLLKIKLLCLVVIVLSALPTVNAKPPSNVKYSVQRQENTKTREILVLPYAFSTDDLGLVMGIGAMATGVYQQQMSLSGTVYGGEETKGIGLNLRNYRVLDSDRLFFSAIGIMGEFPLLRAYAPLPGEFTATPRAGDNDSNFDDFIEGYGSSNWWDVTLEYVFPWGKAKDNSMARYELVGGLLKNNSPQVDWNPLVTGTSILVARQFNRYQLYQNETQQLSGAVHALELGFFYDNTDFPANPSQGSSQYIAYTHYHSKCWISVGIKSHLGKA